MAKFGGISKATIKEGIADSKIKDEDEKDRCWREEKEEGGGEARISLFKNNDDKKKKMSQRQVPCC